MLLRPIEPAEAEDLAARFAAIEPWSRYPFKAKSLCDYLAGEEAGAPRYAIDCGGKVIGAIGLRLNWLRGPYVQFLGIAPEHQSAGAGGHVLAWLLKDAAASGARNLWVAASAFNSRALAFYTRHGFERVAILDGLIQDGIDEVLLRKRL